MEFDEIRAYLDGTAVDIGHFVSRDGSVEAGIIGL